MEVKRLIYSNSLALIVQLNYNPGGTVRDNVDCTGLNGTCDKHALNRELYPLDKDITEGDQLTCFIPDTWLNS